MNTGEDTTSGSLELTGFVREADLCVDRLVHLPGVGDFQIESIEKLKDPCSLANRGVYCITLNNRKVPNHLTL